MISVSCAKIYASGASGLTSSHKHHVTSFFRNWQSAFNRYDWMNPTTFIYIFSSAFEQVVKKDRVW